MGRSRRALRSIRALVMAKVDSGALETGQAEAALKALGKVERAGREDHARRLIEAVEKFVSIFLRSSEE